MSIGNTYSTSDLRHTIKWHMAKMLFEQKFDLVQQSSSRKFVCIVDFFTIQATKNVTSRNSKVAA